MPPSLPRYLLPVPILALVFHAVGREKQESWIQARSPHFIVVANASEKQARRVAGQFERIRSVFHEAFPTMRADPSASIIVLAARNQKDPKLLLPDYWEQPGHVKQPSTGKGAQDERVAPPRLAHRDRRERKRRDYVYGDITRVKCSPPAVIDITLDTSGGKLELHSDNYFKIEFSALNFTSDEDFKPCTQLRGKRARVTFLRSEDQSKRGQILSIALRD